MIKYVKSYFWPERFFVAAISIFATRLFKSRRSEFLIFDHFLKIIQSWMIVYFLDAWRFWNWKFGALYEQLIIFLHFPFWTCETFPSTEIGRRFSKLNHITKNKKVEIPRLISVNCPHVSTPLSLLFNYIAVYQCFPVPPFSSSFRSVPFLKTRTAQIVPFRSVPSVPTVGRNGTERNDGTEKPAVPN